MSSNKIPEMDAKETNTTAESSTAPSVLSSNSAKINPAIDTEICSFLEAFFDSVNGPKLLEEVLRANCDKTCEELASPFIAQLGKGNKDAIKHLEWYHDQVRIGGSRKWSPERILVNPEQVVPAFRTIEQMIEKFVEEDPENEMTPRILVLKGKIASLLAVHDLPVEQ